MHRRHVNRTRITSEIIADDERLGEFIDKILLSDRILLRIQRQIVRRQRALRAVVDDEQWHAYMHVEETFTDFHGRAVVAVVRAPYKVGRRQRGLKRLPHRVY